MNQSTVKKTNLKDYKNQRVEIMHNHSQKWNDYSFCSKLRKKILVWKAEKIIKNWIAMKRYMKSKTQASYLEAKLAITLFFADSEYFTEWNEQDEKVQKVYVEIFMNNHEAYQVLISQPFHEQLDIIRILLEWPDAERVTGINELEILTVPLI
jgi:hypothetical protein